MSVNNQSYLEWALIIIALVLVGVIWLLSQVLITLSKQILKKRKNEMSLKSFIVILFSSILSSTASAQESYIISGLPKDTKYGNMGFIEFYSMIAVVGIELLVILYLALMIRRSFRELSGEADAALSRAGEPSNLSKWWSTIDKKWMTRAVPIEKEADVLVKV
jgi:hypothetical protein